MNVSHSTVVVVRKISVKIFWIIMWFSSFIRFNFTGSQMKKNLPLIIQTLKRYLNRWSHYWVKLSLILIQPKHHVIRWGLVFSFNPAYPAFFFFFHKAECYCRIFLSLGKCLHITTLYYPISLISQFAS